MPLQAFHTPHHTNPSHTRTHTYTRTPHRSPARSRPRAQGTVKTAAEEEMLSFRMTEAQLRQWVEANPGRVNDKDSEEVTPLCFAVWCTGSPSMTLWLLDEKGADINGKSICGSTPIHFARSLDILNALLDRGADPVILGHNKKSPLMQHAHFGRVDLVARLLQDLRVRASVDAQDRSGATALHHACWRLEESPATSIVHLLLQAGADPGLTTERGNTPLTLLRKQHSNYHTTIALLDQVPDAEKAALLIKARRLVVASMSDAAAPSYLQGRMARGQPLPHVALVPMTGPNNDGNEEGHTMLMFLLGMGGGPEDEGVPREVFRVVMDFIMPSWDPLRVGVVGDGGPLEAE